MAGGAGLLKGGRPGAAALAAGDGGPAAAGGRRAWLFERLRGAIARQAGSGQPGSGAAATAPGGAARAIATAAAPDDAAARRPALDKVSLRQRLYGAGGLIPGDADFLIRLVAPLKFGAASSLLDLAAGLGGPAQIIAGALHMRVTGLVSDHGYVERGNALAAAAGLAHLVRLVPCNPATVELGTAIFDGVLGREACSGLIEKERFLRVAAQSLRPRGQIILTDFVRDRSGGGGDALAAWSEAQEQPKALWTAAQYADCLKSVGFALKDSEDISLFYRRQIIAAWIAYLRGGEIRGLPAEAIEVVLGEAEACRRTVAALESGALRYHRVHAVAR